MEHIVVGIDEELASQVAVDWVIDRARRQPAHVTLVTAFDLLVSDPLKDGDRLRATQSRIMTAAPDATVDTKLIDRSIFEELIQQSASADLLVIGSHPHHRVRSALTGALPARIAARTHCPTVVVPDDWDRGVGAVVVGIDYDNSSDDAAVFAGRQAVAEHATLQVVHGYVASTPNFSYDGTGVVSPAETTAAQNAVLRAASRRIETIVVGARAHRDLHDGPAVEALLAHANGARLIVIGSHHWGPVVALLLNGTARELLHVGITPICVVPLGSMNVDRDAVLDGSNAANG